MQKFSFTHIVTSADPVIIDSVIVMGNVFFDKKGYVTDVCVTDILYKEKSIMQLLQVISPDFIIECEAAALDCAKSTMEPRDKEADEIDHVRQAI